MAWQGANRKKPTTSADERRQAKSRESLITGMPILLPLSFFLSLLTLGEDPGIAGSTD